HRSDRCRNCGKLQAGVAVDALGGGPQGETPAVNTGPEPVGAPLALDALPAFTPAPGAVVELDAAEPRPILRPGGIRPSAKVLKAQAQERRDRLPNLLERLIDGGRPTREEAIDVVLAVIEDAHSANPVLFGI